MRPQINPPSQRPDLHGRILECAFAIEPTFQAVAEAAQQAGWKPDEVSFALFDLALHRIIAMSGDDEKTVYEAAALAMKELSRP